jgi:hypothetical protein
VKNKNPAKEYGHFDIDQAMVYLFWENMLYANYEFARFSLLKLREQYRNKEESLAQQFPGYHFNEMHILEPNEDTERLDLDTVMDLLKRPLTSEEEYEEASKVLDGSARFLDKKCSV